MALKENFVINLQGKSYVTYEGLLDLAHQKKLKSIEVELIQVPTKENNMTAICKATAISENGKFIDFGDASPQSVNINIEPHLIRMASTRAKARALRDLTNVGMTAIEEINIDEINETPQFNTNEKQDINFSIDEPPTKRQIETIQNLSDSLNINVDINSLTKKTAGTLISKMLNQKYKRH
ncbi:hypothetical protein [Thermohalobacter berrensis]|uniref:Uncharacterized protein n=1 Tax=Thermohalobacter berrensis TaxID=99594 RepID=A0A419SXY0_9FIRM|nr:hypothetical protein [Thermohalobacter berrensis]RKD30120.1 hypothetical protein BET03_05285 [Thermohalobacter berrensis]